MSTDAIKILAKIKKIEKYLLKISDFQKFSLDELKNRENDLSALKWYLYTAFDSMISLFQMYISFRKFEIPERYQDTVDILVEEKEINLSQEKLLRNIIGLRNALSHDYEKLNMEKIKKVVDEHLKEVEKFLSFIKEKII